MLIVCGRYIQILEGVYVYYWRAPRCKWIQTWGCSQELGTKTQQVKSAHDKEICSILWSIWNLSFFQHLIFFLDGTETGGILQGDVLSWLAYIATATKNRNMFPGWYRWCIDDVYLVFKVFIFFLVSMWVLLTQQTTGSPTIFYLAVRMKE